LSPDARIEGALTVHRRRSSATGLPRHRRNRASAQYAPSGAHPRKNPPCMLAHTANMGGSHHSHRRYSRAAMTSASSRKPIRNGRSEWNLSAMLAARNAAPNAR
jgi:hypothetical protein